MGIEAVLGFPDHLCPQGHAAWAKTLWRKQRI